jgi:hypothetical protein
LELIRTDGSEFQHPDFAEALALVESDEEAREIFARRQRQDREIARAMEAVSVPEGLKDRLNAALANETVDKSRAAEVSTLPKRFSRRWILSACVVMASGLLAAIGVWFWGERPEPLLNLAELANEAPFEEAEVANLSAFQGSFDPVKPGDYWMSDQLFAFSSPAKGFTPNREGSDRVAVYEFFFRDPRPQIPGTLRGVMLVIPQSEVADKPESQRFLDGNYVTYQSRPTVAVRSWSEGGFVYVCLVPIEHYEALTEVFDAVPA